MGASGSKSPTKEINKSEEQIDKQYNKYIRAPEGFVCNNNITNNNITNNNITNDNITKDNITKDNIPIILDIIIYFLIIFIILFASYLLYNGVIK
jgi:hypothetical protein